MTKAGTAKLFKHGRNQAVRLPKEFRMAGAKVRVHRIWRGVLPHLIEQDLADVAATFAEIDRQCGAGKGAEYA